MLLVLGWCLPGQDLIWPGLSPLLAIRSLIQVLVKSTNEPQDYWFGNSFIIIGFFTNYYL